MSPAPIFSPLGVTGNTCSVWTWDRVFYFLWSSALFLTFEGALFVHPGFCKLLETLASTTPTKLRNELHVHSIQSIFLMTNAVRALQSCCSHFNRAYTRTHTDSRTYSRRKVQHTNVYRALSRTRLFKSEQQQSGHVQRIAPTAARSTTT